MRNIFTLLILVLSAFSSVQAQTYIISEDFTSFSDSTRPAGFTFYNLSSTPQYTSTQSAGPSGPNSFKFGLDSTVMITPQFTGADSVRFWLKGNSTDSISTFYILESADNVTYDTIDVINPIPRNSTPVNGVMLTYGLQPTTEYVIFVYDKNLGNVAFDDLRVFSNSTVVANFTANTVCQGDTTRFTNNSSAAAPATIISYGWSFGDGSFSTDENPTHLYAAAGDYSVRLIVTSSTFAMDTVTNIVTVNEVPQASFTATVSNDTVYIDNTSMNVDSTMDQFIFDFGDGFIDTAFSPAPHFYDTMGTYTICLSILNTAGCSDSACTPANTIVITSVKGVTSTLRNAMPNPSRGIVNIGALTGSMNYGVYDILGNIVIRKSVTAGQNTIDLSELNDGNYFIKALDGSASSVIKVTLVK